MSAGIGRTIPLLAPPGKEFLELHTHGNQSDTAHRSTRVLDARRVEDTAFRLMFTVPIKP